MKEYRFNNVVFTPNNAHKLTFDNKTVHMQPLQVKLLIYLLENAGKVKTKNEIQDAVWGPGEHSHASLSKAISTLHDLLPDDCRVTTITRIGYCFDHKVICTTAKHPRLEYLFEHSAKFKLALATALTLFAVIAILLVVEVYLSLNTKPRYQLDNTKGQFARDYIVGTAQLSPDKRFLAHRLSKDIFAEDYLGILDLKLGDTRPIVPMGFLDGYKWNLTGDKIVYQKTITGLCEIRLVSFLDENKSQFTDEQLGICDQYSGHISFAWYNEYEFYANFVSAGAPATANNLPLHHLYAFNIKTKSKKPIKKAVYQGGFGFYSLEYDPITKLLHLLQTDHFKTTDFYQYDGKKLVKVHTLDQYVPFYTVFDNKLIYKNKQANFVINDPADDFDNPQVFVRPQGEMISQPHLMADQIVFIAGAPFGIALHQLTDNQLTEVKVQRFNPVALASYNNQLVFAAKQTGIKQIYIIGPDGEIKKISNMVINENIKSIEVAGNVFVLSYADRVDIYHLQHQQLQLVKSLPQYHRGVIHPNGKMLLLSSTNVQGQSVIVEKRLSDLTPTGREVSNARFAFYHQDNIIYLNNEKELIRIENGEQRIIASNIDVPEAKNTTINGDDFYYINRYHRARPIIKLNLISGTKSQIATGHLRPIQLHVVGDRLVISTTKALKPVLITGQLVTY